jgi:hypothetical protein
MFRALMLARHYCRGWEGDIRGFSEIYVSGVPVAGDPTCALMIAWKQENNGDTFVASETELPHPAEGLVFPKDRMQ